VSVATYQHVLWTYRPYAWLSLALLVGLLVRPMRVGAEDRFVAAA
jgi:hypothetical protein